MDRTSLGDAPPFHTPRADAQPTSKNGYRQPLPLYWSIANPNPRPMIGTYTDEELRQLGQLPKRVTNPGARWSEKPGVHPVPRQRTFRATGTTYPIYLSEAPGGVRLSDTLMRISYDHDIDAFLAGSRRQLSERIPGEEEVDVFDAERVPRQPIRTRSRNSSPVAHSTRASVTLSMSSRPGSSSSRSDNSPAVASPNLRSAIRRRTCT